MIADIDVGVDADHPELKGRLTPGFDFFMNDRTVTSETENNHGTNVAGVLGAATDNGEGIAGIAPDAQIMPVRTADNILHQGSRLAAGIVWAADHGADVISMSLGAESRSAALDKAVAYAHRKGVVLVAAIGNESANHHNYPATYDEVIAVGGINPDTADAAAQGRARAADAGRHGLHRARRLLRLRPAHRPGRADAGADHRLRRRLPAQLERHLGGHAARGRRRGAREGGAARA